LLAVVSWSTKWYKELDQLYSRILSAAVNDLKEEKDNIYLTLRTVVCAKELMTAQTLALLLSLTEEQVNIVLQPLQLILHMQDSKYGLVSPFHASFPDYLFYKDQPGGFHCKLTE